MRSVLGDLLGVDGLIGVLHAMHEFFLTARSLYLLVLGERDDMAERDAAPKGERPTPRKAGLCP